MRLTVFLFLPLTCIMSVITACGWGCEGGEGGGGTVG